MTTPRRKPAAKKQAPVEQPAPQAAPEEMPAQDLALVHDETAPAQEWPIVDSPLAIVEQEPEPEAPEHVRQLARTIRRHLGNPRIQFDAAQGVPVIFGYNGLSHAVNGHGVRHIATRDELSEMSDQQIWDCVMQGRQGPRQSYPLGG